MQKTVMIAALAAAALVNAAPVLAQGSGSGYGSMGGIGSGSHGMMGSDHKSMMQSAEPSAAEGVAAVGVVNGVDQDKRTVNVTHEPIAALGWPSMTMYMTVSERVDLSHVPVGRPVDITLSRGGDGIYRVDGISAQ